MYPHRRGECALAAFEELLAKSGANTAEGSRIVELLRGVYSLKSAGRCCDAGGITIIGPIGLCCTAAWPVPEQEIDNRHHGESGQIFDLKASVEDREAVVRRNDRRGKTPRRNTGKLLDVTDRLGASVVDLVGE